MPRLLSVVVPTALGSGAKKLGQPVPLSNFVDDSNSGKPQAAQAYMPARYSLSSGLVPARSVPCLRMTEKVSAGNSFFHSSSERLIGEACVLLMVSSMIRITSHAINKPAASPEYCDQRRLSDITSHAPVA